METRIHPETGKLLTRREKSDTLPMGGWYPDDGSDAIHTGEDITNADIVYRLTKRAEIRRNIASRKSVQEGKPDRIAALLDEAAAEIIRLRQL